MSAWKAKQKDVFSSRVVLHPTPDWTLRCHGVAGGLDEIVDLWIVQPAGAGDTVNQQEFSREALG